MPRFGTRIAQATLRKLENLLDEIRRDVLKAVQEQGVIELQLLNAALEQDKTFTSDGIAVAPRPFGARWARRKLRKGWSMRKLDATGVLRTALKNPGTKIDRPQGYVFAPARANPRIRHYYRALVSPGGRLRKAPHLMRNLAPGWEERHVKAVKKKVGLLVRAKLGVAKKILGAKQYDAVVELKLGRLAGRGIV